MKRLAIILPVFILIFLQCSGPVQKDVDDLILNQRLPRALMITSGISDEKAELAQGVVIAVQSFNKRGIPVRLEARNILYDYHQLSQYSILILSTFPGYHDADRKYSLSYMNDEELQNLKRFVQHGGVLIAGDNVGRNFSDGTDRIVEFSELTKENWALSECFGVSLSERNMTGYDISGEIHDYVRWFNHAASLTPAGVEKWTLVPDSIHSPNLKVVGYWKKDADSVPAILENNYEKGTSFLLASSGYLHPTNDGGYWSEKQIEGFYNYVIDKYNESNKIGIELNPWPDGHDYAFCATFNAQGSIEQYERVFKVLKKEKIQPTIFVNGLVNDEVKSYLRSSNYPLGSSGYSYKNFQRLMYPESLDDILYNSNFWEIEFKGFRFPYTKPGFWGLMALCENNYTFESSIGANNLEFIHGSVFPHNMVISYDGYYKSINLLEIAPTYHDDYFYLHDVYNDQELNSAQLNERCRVYSTYLGNYWEYAVKPYNGLMVYLGHPQYVGYNDTTLASLTDLISMVKQDDTWITTINEVAKFRKGLSALQFYYTVEEDRMIIEVSNPEDKEVKAVGLNLSNDIRSVSINKGEVLTKEKNGYPQLIFDAADGQIITIHL